MPGLRIGSKQVKVKHVILILVMIASLMLTFAFSVKKATVDMYRGDARHSGLLDVMAIKKVEGTAWSFATEGEIYSSPLVVRDTIYFGSDDGYFYAVDKKTQQLNWKFNATGKIRTAPAVYNDTVYFMNSQGGFFALDRQTGEERWQYAAEPTAEGELDSWDYYDSSPCIADGMVIFGGGGRNVYALDLADGTRQWVFKTKSPVKSTPAYADGVVYFGDWAGNFYAVDADDAELQWKFSNQGNTAVKSGQKDAAEQDFAAGAIHTSPTVADGIVFFGSRDANLYALDAQTGQEKWRFTMPEGSWVASSTAVVDDMVYVGGADSRGLYALDAATGQVRWKQLTGKNVFSSPIVADGLVYVATGSPVAVPGSEPGDEYVTAFEAVTGKEVWKVGMDHPVLSSVYVSLGKIFVTSVDGRLYVLN